MSIKNIAERLSIKESTVKYHCGETYRKLNAKSKLEAINEARKRNLI
ncbi:MAG: LuxR C-terminal-related transcriptional regulator [Acutalibacteraceae bacterium]|nr:LuxR C-terminal-related transcriptional regulator [Acutalibacteraceae bacterium]